MKSRQEATSKAHAVSFSTCKVCTNCSFCTGYGARCYFNLSRDRIGDKGKVCGCGIGDAGCSDCGMCRKCCDSSPKCGASSGDTSSQEQASQNRADKAIIISATTTSTTTTSTYYIIYIIIAY